MSKLFKLVYDLVFLDYFELFSRQAVDLVADAPPLPTNVEVSVAPKDCLWMDFIEEFLVTGDFEGFPGFAVLHAVLLYKVDVRTCLG